MDCHDSKLNDTVFGIHDWLTYLRDQAAKCRKLVKRADDPLVKTELLALASVCADAMPCALSTPFSPAMGERHEAPAPIMQETEPPAACRARETAAAVTGNGAGSGPRPNPVNIDPKNAAAAAQKRSL